MSKHTPESLYLTTSIRAQTFLQPSFKDLGKFVHVPGSFCNITITYGGILPGGSANSLGETWLDTERQGHVYHLLKEKVKLLPAVS